MCWGRTSLSSCFASSVICLMTSRGASSESLTMNAETDLGPLVSFELNSLFASSLDTRLAHILPPCSVVAYFKISSESCG